MSTTLIGVVTALYLLTAMDYWVKRDLWSGWVWAAYALANVGLLKVMSR